MHLSASILAEMALLNFLIKLKDVHLLADLLVLLPALILLLRGIIAMPRWILVSTTSNAALVHLISESKSSLVVQALLLSPTDPKAVMFLLQRQTLKLGMTALLKLILVSMDTTAALALWILISKSTHVDALQSNTSTRLKDAMSLQL
jgi:hypothetical protein